ncbi:response regulator [Oceanospirillum beijerinckii]|uniref:response regulator n=1 Tax=Oceanospirillum beijerinckii TaxID=64976 RepID=UPI0003F89E8D
MMDSTQQVLVVEDEEKLAQVLKEYLQQAGYEAHCLYHGDKVMPWLESSSPDMIILDLMLPGTDGVTLCRQIRENSNVPIIMATAKVEEADRLRGLDIGADDYVCKPYSHREMVARVKAILRRTTPDTAVQEKKGDNSTLFTVDADKMTVCVRQKELDLTPVEFRLLSHMLQRQGIVFSRNDLLDIIYDDYRMVSDRTIDTHIKNVRKKLQNALPDLDVIHSIYGVGYKLEVKTA